VIYSGELENNMVDDKHQKELQAQYKPEYDEFYKILVKSKLLYKGSRRSANLDIVFGNLYEHLKKPNGYCKDGTPND